MWLRGLFELLERREDALGLAERCPAARRERHPARRALEKADAQRFLERLDLAGERGLAHVQLFGSACQLPDLRDRDECAQLIKLHGYAIVPPRGHFSFSILVHCVITGVHDRPG